MAKEETFIDRADAERVRREIATTGEAALALLKDELQLYRQMEKLPKRWCDNFKTICDQLRRDYRLEPAAEDASAAGEDPPPPAEPDDPLASIRLMTDALESEPEEAPNGPETSQKKTRPHGARKQAARGRKTGAA